MNDAERERDRRIEKLDDMALLRVLVGDGTLGPTEREPFETMLREFVRCERLRLSDRQRAWAEDAARRTMPLDARLVPRGRDVPTPEVLRVLPKKPPGQAERP